MAKKTVQLEDPDAENEGVKVQQDGRVYLGQELAGETVDIYAEVTDADATGGDDDG